MILNKKILAAAVVAAMTLPVIASAQDLLTTNETDESSAVRVTSGLFNGSCTGTVPDKLKAVTPPHSVNVPVSWDKVKGLCFNSPNDTCTADIHMTANCSDAPVAKASLNLKNPSVTVVQIMNPRYALSASGTSVLIKYAGK